MATSHCSSTTRSSGPPPRRSGTPRFRARARCPPEVTRTLPSGSTRSGSSAGSSPPPTRKRRIVVPSPPDASGPLSGALTFTSNDPDENPATVALRGQGVIPPEIAASPDSLAASLFTGQTTARSLTLSNRGGSNLEFEVSVEGVRPAAPAGLTIASAGPRGALLASGRPVALDRLGAGHAPFPGEIVVGRAELDRDVPSRPSVGRAELDRDAPSRPTELDRDAPSRPSTGRAD